MLTRNAITAGQRTTGNQIKVLNSQNFFSTWNCVAGNGYELFMGSQVPLFGPNGLHIKNCTEKV